MLCSFHYSQGMLGLIDVIFSSLLPVFFPFSPLRGCHGDTSNLHPLCAAPSVNLCILMVFLTRKFLKEQGVSYWNF